jgi:hypothetical protein
MTRVVLITLFLSACGPPEPDKTTPTGFAEAYAAAACGCADRPHDCRAAVEAMVLMDLAEASCVDLDLDQADLCVAVADAYAETRDACTVTSVLGPAWTLLAACPGLCPTDDSGAP